MRVDSGISGEEALRILHYHIERRRIYSYIGFASIALSPVFMISMVFMWVMAIDLYSMEALVRLLLSIIVGLFLLTLGFILLIRKDGFLIKELMFRCWHPYNPFALKRNRDRLIFYGLMMGCLLMPMIIRIFFWDEGGEDEPEVYYIFGGLFLVLLIFVEYQYLGTNKFKGNEWKSFNDIYNRIIPIVGNSLNTLGLNFSYENTSTGKFNFLLPNMITDKFTVKNYDVDIWVFGEDRNNTGITIGPVTPTNEDIIIKIQNTIDRQYALNK